MKEMKRILSLVLCLVMLVGLIPVGALTADAAENDTIYVLAGGDFQEAGDHANSAANVTNILAQVSQKYQTMDGFLFIGDYDCETHDSATETANGITALMGAVQGKYSNLNNDNSVLVQGNHDYMDSRIDKTGGHEFEGYSTYVLNEDDYPNGGGSQSDIQTLANNLKTWLNNKIGEGYTAPIFIVSHLPLAFTPRTVTQGDAKYAKYIFDVLNDAGKNGLNIIFLHGHDHAYGPDNYMGGEAIYLPVGDKICIAEAGSTSAWTEETLNFTYMNAGYTGYYSDAFTYVTTAGTDKLTMTVFAITDNQVTVERYSESGLYNLKSAGYDGSYSNTSVTNVSLGLPKYSAVYASPQTIALVDNGAADMGTIGEWVGIAAETPADDVTTSNKGWVELVAPVPETPAVPGTNGTYGKIAGDLTYNATVGMTAEQAMALVQSGIDGYNYDAMFTPGSDVTGTKMDDSVLTWQWVDTFDSNTAGDYEVAIKYGDFLLGTAEVVVPAATTYYVAEGNGLYLVDMNTTEANAMAAVKTGVTVYSATDASGSNKTAISDDDVTWNWVDKYNGADSGPYTVEILYDGTSLGTVEVKVNIQYETGINSDWTYIGAEGSGYRYVLDTNGIDYGSSNKYLIVGYLSSNTDGGYDYALTANGSNTGAVHVDINDDTIIVDTRDYEWYFATGLTNTGSSTYNTFITQNGTTWLYHTNSSMYVGNGSDAHRGYWSASNRGNGVYRFGDQDGAVWYLRYSSGSNKFTVKNSTSSNDVDVRLYKYDGELAGGPIYALIEGDTVYTVSQGTSATKALAAVKAGIIGYTATDANGTGKTEIADSDLTWKWKNTFNGNSTGSYWVEISYQGKVLGTVEVKVEPGVVNNYPEYPNEGAVKVSKTGTGIDFQSSGIAQVEVSASGVPIKKGADVIVMLDTSSSMTSHNVTGTSKTRAQVLEESLKNLIAQFKTPGDDGQLLDLRVAIADFNGFYGENHNASGTPYDRDAADMMSDDVSYNANSEAQVYTGDGTLGAGAFIPVEDLAASYTLNYTSGTNYDYAFDAIYQMGTAIKEANGSEERDLYVIFMSDGAAMQWNYYHSQGASSLWNNWITGAWNSSDLTTNLNCTTHAYYYDEVDHNGDGMRNEHRMANAIKGDPSEQYEVIRKTDTLGTPTDETNMYMVPGLGAKMFSISFDAQADTNVTAASMDKSIASLASPQTGTTQYYYKVTSAAELSAAFDSIGSEIAYAAYNARFVDQMGDDYNLQMAVSNYTVVNEDNSTTSKTITPKIEIISYDIYTRQDYLNGTITADKIGDRKGTFTVLETVTFNADGTEAYSDKKTGNIMVGGVIYANTFWYNTNDTAVAVEGVSIPTGTKADGTTTGSTKLLPSETFYWKMGTVQTSELAMRYYVYLDGSMEGTREGGSYPTNEYATLYYDNYLNNPCKKDTVSPVMAWKEANVSYAFYLVNENGEIIVNQTTGQTGSFANKIAVTNPVVYDTVLLNTDEEIDAVKAAEVLPEGYTLFDATYNASGVITDGAVYTVTVNSNTTGGWNIRSVKDVDTTYVMHYDTENASAYSKEKTVNEVGHDYTHTVVWFAVVWKVQALPDTVVIDYGLPVDISVLTNDMFGENGKLAGVGAASNLPEGYDSATDGDDAMASGFGNSFTGTYGKADITTTPGKVRYTPVNMEMNGYDKFAYAVNYTGATNPGYYYDTVTVIPATTIYYEDNFITTKTYTWDYDINGWALNTNSSVWTQIGEVNGVQQEDRPGQYALTDANNIYGYDEANLRMTEHSLDSALKAAVDFDNKAEASFTFYGTGFDVISMTNADTGTILVDVYPMNTDGTTGAAIKNLVVDTYYGYKQADCHVIYTYRNTADEGKPEKYEWVLTEVRHEVSVECKCTVATELPKTGTAGQEVTIKEKAWIKDPTSTDAIWQVPVMKVENLTYGRYKAVIQVIYEPGFDHKAGSYEGTYDFYLDAVRIYDPANDGASDGTTDTTIEDAYKADGEGWPSYIELRNQIIAANSFDDIVNSLPDDDATNAINGLVFIDGDSSVEDGEQGIADYKNYGPNNELYLAPGQSVAFLMETPSNLANVHIGIKSADGKVATYEITNIARNDIESGATKVKVGSPYNPKTYTISTTTDMYYDLTGWKNDIIVITNTSDKNGGIISLTNIKSTYTSDPNATNQAGEEATEPNSEQQISETADVLMASSETAAEEQVNPNETYIYMTVEAAKLTIRALNGEMEEEVPEETEPEVTEPETEATEPETETTEPETEVTEPETEATKPETEVTEPEPKPEDSNTGKTLIKIIKKLLGWLFG